MTSIRHCALFLSLAVSATHFALCNIVEAQQAKKIPLVGYLGNTVTGPDHAITPLRERLRELGYSEGQNVISEYRYGDEKRDRPPELAADLVRLKVDIIVVVGGTGVIQAAKMRPRQFPSLWQAKDWTPSRQG